MYIVTRLVTGQSFEFLAGNFVLFMKSASCHSQSYHLIVPHIFLNKSINSDLFAFNFSQENVEEFKFLYRPYRLSKNLIKDAFAYLCHTNTAKAMHKVG